MITPNSSFLGIKVIDFDDNTQVDSGGGTDTKTLQPPAGQCYKICALSMLMPDPNGSASGTHRIICATTGMYQSKLFCSANTGSSVKWQYAGLGGSSEYPSAQGDQQRAIYNTWATYDNPFTFVYTNDTDTHQTAIRRLQVMVEVHKDCF